MTLPHSFATVHTHAGSDAEHIKCTNFIFLIIMCYVQNYNNFQTFILKFILKLLRPVLHYHLSMSNGTNVTCIFNRIVLISLFPGWKYLIWLCWTRKKNQRKKDNKEKSMMTTFVERNNNILKSYKSVSTLFVKSSAKQTDVFFFTYNGCSCSMRPRKIDGWHWQ